MVALIRTSYAIRRILNYNENKVKLGIAECIGEGNYPSDARKMTFSFKLNRFLNLLQLNPNVVRNSVHISLNFVPTEAVLPRKTLVRIAERYMHKIGFGDQPYLIYQHLDAGHPHLHLVSINVRSDGTRINMFHLGRTHSVKACREIENEFGLLVPRERKKTPAHSFAPIIMGKIAYGKHPSIPFLTEILRDVLGSYHFTTLTELNAVLRQYNVWADQGPEGSKMFKKGGLVYRILSPEERPIGAYIRASDLSIKATLKFLVQRFKENEAIRLPFKSRIQHTVNKCLMGEMMSIEHLIMELANQGIHLATHRNKASLIHSITYVDHQTKCVFQGTSLGKPYRAEAILEKCLPQQPLKNNLPYSRKQKASLPQEIMTSSQGYKKESSPDFKHARSEGILHALLKNEGFMEEVPRQLQTKRRRKKRKKNRYSPINH